MEKTIKTDVRGVEALTLFWGQYFPEVPVCTHPDCGCVAAEVDAFFPYIDDFNRCEFHPLEIIDSRKLVPLCGHGTIRGIGPRSGMGDHSALSDHPRMCDHHGRVARITWRPAR